MADTALIRQLVVFKLGNEHYALPIESVQEIIRFTEPRSVASPEPDVRGVISLRGRIVPVYDIATQLSVASEPGEDAKIVVVDTGGQAVGLIVDGVDEVLSVTEDEISAAPTADAELIEGIVRHEDRLIVLLTLHRRWTAAAELAAAA